MSSDVEFWIERGSFGPDHGLAWAVWRRENGKAALDDTFRTKRAAQAYIDKMTARPAAC